MPIKGLTDELVPAFPTLGKLRKGGARPEDGKAPGKDLEHFRFVGRIPALDAAFLECYGPKPVMLRVYFPYQTPDECFSTWKEAWVAGGLKHRCDGSNTTIILGADGKYSRVPQPCPGGCDEVGRLVFILPELLQAGHVGFVTLETHSIHDILNITASLRLAEEAKGDLRGIEWTLTREPEKISTPSKDGRVRREKWLVKLYPSVRFAQLAFVRQEQIEAPEETDGETGEIIDVKPTTEEKPEPEKKAEPEKKPLSMAELMKRWSVLTNEAKALGVPFEIVPGNISHDELVAKGKALAEAIAAKRGENQ